MDRAFRRPHPSPSDADAVPARYYVVPAVLWGLVLAVLLVGASLEPAGGGDSPAVTARPVAPVGAGS